MIDLKDLPKVSLSNRGNLPAISAVYFCFTRTKVLYVGQSQDIRHRWRGHHKLEELLLIEGVFIGWLDCAPSELAHKEQKYILRLKPLLNRGGSIDQPEAAQIDLSANPQFKPFIDFWEYLDYTWAVDKKLMKGFTRADILSAFEVWAKDNYCHHISNGTLMNTLRMLEIIYNRRNARGDISKYSGFPLFYLKEHIPTF